MNKLCVLACLFVSFAATAQTAPKIVFVGDDLTASWQASSEFTANKNWVGEGFDVGLFSGSGEVLQDFQAGVINQHPAFVHIMTGFSDAETVKDSTPTGVVFGFWQANVVEMVAMAKKANIKVILGNLMYLPNYVPSGAIAFMNPWLDEYGRANNIPVVNYSAAFCQCAGIGVGFQSNNYIAADGVTLTDAGYALMTQMAQTAIATYGLTIKSGYLSNVGGGGDETMNIPSQPQVNNVQVGEIATFTPQAKWSDGVVRPMSNMNFDGMLGIWTSSNPTVMYISQQGQALALTPGTTTISFKSASGVPFSPWGMTVVPEPFNF
jgi:hypothetical protein